MAESITAYEALTKHLAATEYSFICPSPETAGRVVEKRYLDPSTRCARNAQDFFGWSLPCSRYVLSHRYKFQQRFRELMIMVLSLHTVETSAQLIADNLSEIRSEL